MDIIRSLVIFLAFAGAFLNFIFLRRLTNVFKWIAWYLLFSGTSQLIGTLIIPYTGSNIPIFNISMAVNFVLLFSILYHLFKTQYLKKMLGIIFAVSGVLFLYLMWLDFPHQFASRALTVLNISIISGCLLFYYEMLRMPEMESIMRQGKFWIATALLIYHGSSFAFWLIFEISTQNNVLQILDLMNGIFVILLYLMLIWAIFVQIKNRPHDQRQ